MKYLILALLMSGCAATRASSMIFLKEESSSLQNLEGIECVESGYQLDKDGKRLITYYKNCSIHKYRVLEEYEIKQWADPNKLKEKRKLNGPTSPNYVP